MCVFWQKKQKNKKQHHLITTCVRCFYHKRYVLCNANCWNLYQFWFFWNFSLPFQTSTTDMKLGYILVIQSHSVPFSLFFSNNQLTEWHSSILWQFFTKTFGMLMSIFSIQKYGQQKKVWKLNRHASIDKRRRLLPHPTPTPPFGVDAWKYSRYFEFSIKFNFADMDSIKILFFIILTNNRITTKSSFFKLLPTIHIVLL